MFKFIKESLKELEHVVWPTNKETTAYFKIVVSVIVIFGLFLFAVGTFMSFGLYAIKDIVKPVSIQTTSNNTPSNVDLNLSGSQSNSGKLNLNDLKLTPEVKTTATWANK